MIVNGNWGSDVRGLGSFATDARKAITENPDYFVWWYSVKSWLLVGTVAALAYQLGKRSR